MTLDTQGLSASSKGQPDKAFGWSKVSKNKALASDILRLGHLWPVLDVDPASCCSCPVQGDPCGKRQGQQDIVKSSKYHWRHFLKQQKLVKMPDFHSHRKRGMRYCSKAEQRQNVSKFSVAWRRKKRKKKKGKLTWGGQNILLQQSPINSFRFHFSCGVIKTISNKDKKPLWSESWQYYTFQDGQTGCFCISPLQEQRKMFEFISKTENLSKTSAYFTASQFQQRGVLQSKSPHQKASNLP